MRQISVKLNKADASPGEVADALEKAYTAMVDKREAGRQFEEPYMHYLKAQSDKYWRGIIFSMINEIEKVLERN